MPDSIAPLDCLVAKAGALYSLPAVAMEVLELTNNPKVDVHALKECIENDPALTTKVLRVVNSSLFGISREVSDLNQALALLGTKPLKLLVLGFSLPERLFDGVTTEILGWYWRHTLTKAVAAREISETLERPSGDEAFIAGLLQDLGILLLLQELGSPYMQFLEKVRTNGSDLAALETASLGFDHTTLTSRLLEHWGLPQVLVEAVRRADPEAPSLSPPSAAPLAHILHLAEMVAQLVADGFSDALGELLAVGDESCGLTREQLEQLVGDLEAKVAQLAEVLSLRLPDGRDYRDVLVEAHKQLARVAAETAQDLIRHEAGWETLEAGSEALVHEFRALSEALARVSQPGSDSAASAPLARPATEPAAVPSSAHPAPGSPAWSASTDTARSMVAQSMAAEIDPGLLGQLHAAIASCRQWQCALTLLLVELDDVPTLAMTCGVDGVEKVRRFLQAACRDLGHPETICLPYEDHGFAVILPDCERQPAVRYANELIDRVRQASAGVPSRGRPAFSVSVGAATVSVPTRNFLPQDLFEGAQRCLFGARASGGGVAKSIETY
jgi:HD-like signal output (HDOD) protein/GGDEF domain-containing protein